MDLQLVGKRALVTGSSSGLGEAIVRRLAAEGAAVVVHGRDRRRTSAVATSIREDGGIAGIAIGDLATDAGAGEVQAAAVGDGSVDILVNNVGIYAPTAQWAETPPDAWAEMYNINVISSVRMIQHLVPGMRARGWGRVIQISSVTGRLPAANQPHYAATNAARNNLAISLARELKHSGVTSNAVAPGGILTPATVDFLVGVGKAQGWGETWAEIEPKASALAPNDVGRIGKPDEYANLVAFLASPAADYINGTTLGIDGGAYEG
ncbi:SDR family NAD(P)-dependent oxidoreductase [Streptomyces sp. x-19]|uniref:SDR family NAD(P)-dependent oxidoreductase n=1 Tax=Streptomyces sp. x-19 TaxID=2789280 RepID=UPI00397FD3EC